MLETPDPTPHKASRTEMTSLFGETKQVLDEKPKAISPFGGLASFIAFLRQIGFAKEVQRHLPFAEPTSNSRLLTKHHDAHTTTSHSQRRRAPGLVVRDPAIRAVARHHAGL
jgi:hypothetical protein